MALAKKKKVFEILVNKQACILNFIEIYIYIYFFVNLAHFGTSTDIMGAIFTRSIITVAAPVVV